MEFGTLCIDIVLVNLVSKYEQVLLVGKLDDSLDVLPGEDLARGVARVDDHNCSHVTFLLGLLDRPFQLLGV